MDDDGGIQYFQTLGLQERQEWEQDQQALSEYLGWDGMIDMDRFKEVMNERA